MRLPALPSNPYYSQVIPTHIQKMQPWQIFPLPKAAPKWEQEAEAYWNRNPALAAEHIFPWNRKAADKMDEEAGNQIN